MTTTSINVPSISGDLAVPITPDALGQLAMGKRGGTYEAGRLMWRRLIEAQRELKSAGKEGPRSNAYRHAWGKVTMMTTIMSDVYGKSRTFWDEESFIACRAPSE